MRSANDAGINRHFDYYRGDTNLRLLRYYTYPIRAELVSKMLRNHFTSCVCTLQIAMIRYQQWSLYAYINVNTCCIVLNAYCMKPNIPCHREPDWNRDNYG